jgi:MFS family permease
LTESDIQAAFQKTRPAKELWMSRELHWYDYITINIYFLGLTSLSQTNGLVFPLLVQQFVGESGKGTFFGNLRLWTLMVALLVQAGMGILSDRSTLRWGRRRPFIFTGTLLDLVFIAAIGFSIGLEGTGGYWFLFAMGILLQVSSNTAQSAQQGLIPDLVPEDKRGRFSAVKAVMELPLPILLVSFTVARLIGAGNMWAGLVVVMGVLVLTMLVTMLVPEKPLEKTPSALDWSPFFRLLLMTGLFTAVILGMGQVIKVTGRVITSLASPIALFAVMGIIGLLAMTAAIGLGVWASVHISLGEAARANPSYTWWVVNRLAYLVGATNLSTFAVFFLQARLGYVREKAAQPAAILMLVVGIFILISALPSGWLADRFGHKRLVAFSGMVAAIGTLIALLVPSLTIIYIGGSLIGLATGVFFTANWALGTELVPVKEAGRYLGISNLAGAGAGAVGAYIGGPIADYFTQLLPEAPDSGYVLLFAIYGALFLLSVAALTRVRAGQRLDLKQA